MRAFNIAGQYYRYDEELVVPIIENTPFEEDLKVHAFIVYSIYMYWAILL